MKAFLDPTRNLDEDVRHLIRHFKKLSDGIELEENWSHHPLHLDSIGMRAFRTPEGYVMLHCLELCNGVLGVIMYRSVLQYLLFIKHVIMTIPMPHEQQHYE